MKKIILSLILLLITSSFFSTSAQVISKAKDIELIQSKKLLVILDEQEEKHMETLTKSGNTAEVARIKALFEQFNAQIKQAFQSYWKMHKEIVYKTYPEYAKMSKEEQEEYVVLTFESYLALTPTGAFRNYRYLVLVPERFGKKRKKPFVDLYHSFSIQDPKFSFPPLFLIYLPEPEPGIQSLHFSLNASQQFMQRYLNKEDVKMNDLIPDDKASTEGLRLKEKTLLINAEDIDSSLTLDEIKQIYPYNVQIVNKEEIAKRIASRDSSFAYFMVQTQLLLPVTISASVLNNRGADFGRFLHLIVDIQSGDLLAEHKVKYHSYLEQDKLRKMTDENLKELVGSFRGK